MSKKGITIARAGRGGTFERITVKSTFQQIVIAFLMLHAANLALLIGYVIAVVNFRLWAAFGMGAYGLVVGRPPLAKLGHIPLTRIIFKKRDADDWHRIFNSMTALFLSLGAAWLLLSGRWPVAVEFGAGRYWFVCEGGAQGASASYGVNAIQFTAVVGLLVCWMSRRYWRDFLWANRQELLLPSDREKTRKAPINPGGIPAPDGYEFGPVSRARDDDGHEFPPEFGSSAMPSKGDVL
ncbi:hypothetical protein GF380_00810 [Candidatus Uhrbacteria bacterium]|nr:hypothetical protein [Candidatus Uhrbacteria bacterium]